MKTKTRKNCVRYEGEFGESGCQAVLSKSDGSERTVYVVRPDENLVAGIEALLDTEIVYDGVNAVVIESEDLPNGRIRLQAGRSFTWFILGFVAGLARPRSEEARQWAAELFARKSAKTKAQIEAENAKLKAELEALRAAKSSKSSKK